MSNMTHKERVASARRTGLYEPLREQLQRLLDEGYTYGEVSRMTHISVSKIKVAICTLELQVGRGRRELERYADAAQIATERTIELALVCAVRQAYGPIGKGFSTA